MFRDDRKGLFSKPKLTLWRCPSFALKAVERENTCLLPQTDVFSRENASFRVRNQPLFETLVWNWKLKTNSVGTSFEPPKTNIFSTSLFVCFCENICFRNVCFRYGNKLFYKAFVLGWNNKLPGCQAETFVFHGHGKLLFRTNLFVWKNLRFETLVWKQWN